MSSIGVCILPIPILVRLICTELEGLGQLRDVTSTKPSTEVPTVEIRECGIRGRYARDSKPIELSMRIQIRSTGGPVSVRPYYIFHYRAIPEPPVRAGIIVKSTSPSSDDPRLRPLELTAEWQTYELPISGAGANQWFVKDKDVGAVRFRIRYELGGVTSNEEVVSVSLER